MDVVCPKKCVVAGEASKLFAQREAQTARRRASPGSAVSELLADFPPSSPPPVRALVRA